MSQQSSNNSGSPYPALAEHLSSLERRFADPRRKHIDRAEVLYMIQMIKQRFC